MNLNVSEIDLVEGSETLLAVVALEVLVVDVRYDESGAGSVEGARRFGGGRDIDVADPQAAFLIRKVFFLVVALVRPHLSRRLGHFKRN